MKLNFVCTIGGNLFYLGDADDEDAPMVEIRFWNEFAEWPKDSKQEMAARMFDAFCQGEPKHKRGSMVTKTEKGLA